MSDKKRSRFSFSAEGLTDPDDAHNPDAVSQALSGTYRSNWPTLKHASQSAAFACVVNMENALLPTATRIVEKHAQLGERAFLLSFNHNNLVGGLALGAVILVAFAQESFLRIAYQLAEELRLQRSRSRRAISLESAVLQSITELDDATFAERCEMLQKVLGIPRSRSKVQQALDLMAFRNTIAHDSPLLNLQSGKIVSVSRGTQRVREERIGKYSTLESRVCPVRLKHVKAAIDAHDHLVTFYLEGSKRQEWVEAIGDFESGVGLRIKDAFNSTHWYEALKASARKWEDQYQSQTEAPLEAFIEMRNAIVRRKGIRDSN